MPEDPRYTPRTAGQSNRQASGDRARTRQSTSSRQNSQFNSEEQRVAARQRVAQRRAASTGRIQQPADTGRISQARRATASEQASQTRRAATSAERAERAQQARPRTEGAPSPRPRRSTNGQAAPASCGAGDARTARAARATRSGQANQAAPANRTYQARNVKKNLPIKGIAIALLAVLVIGGGAWGIRSFMSNSTPDEPAAPVNEGGRVTFVAVGDNLPEQEIGEYADACAGKKGDGDYDYTPIYQYIKPLVQAADLAYMKQETHCGGNDIGPKGYPSFNTTDQMADAVIDTGFDMIGSASNHCYDWGYFGAAKHSRELWASKEVAYTGTATSEEQASQLAIVQRNGITFCLLDYTYGVNAYEEEDLPKGTTNFIDKDRITADVQRAKEVADVVLVAMHWGEENQTYASEFQMQYAKILTDLEVDVVLGSHPHVIGPVEWQTSASGHKTLIAYSLGNFISNHEAPDGDNQLEGMLSCTFVKDPTSGAISIEDTLWTPLVNHNVSGEYAVYPVSQYTAELAKKNPVFGGKDKMKEGWAKDPLTWLVEHTQKVVGKDITVAGMAEITAAKEAEKAAKEAAKASNNSTASNGGDASKKTS